MATSTSDASASLGHFRPQWNRSATLFADQDMKLTLSPEGGGEGTAAAPWPLQITTCVPTSMARSLGMQKYCDASLA